MYSPTSQYLKTRFRWEAMGLSGMGWETWCPPPPSWSFPRQKRRLSPFLATKSVDLGQRYASLISYHYGPFFSVTGSTCTTLTQVMWQSLSRQQVDTLIDIQIDTQWTNYLKFDSDDDILLVWLSTTAQCVLCKVRWHCIFYDAVSDTIRRYRGLITEEGVDTVTYFGGNHGSRVWKSLKT